MTIRSRLHAVDPYENFPLEGAQLDMQGWHSTDPLFAKLIAQVRPERIIEVGTWKGASAIGMANLAKQHRLNTEILCVDTWLGALEFWTSHDDPTRYGSLKLRHGYPGVYYTFLANVVLSGHADMITPFPQTSLTGARWLNMQGIQADLIYIDGSHEEADVLADVAAYWPALRTGGVIFGDDFSPAWPSVMRAVRTFARQHGLTLEEDNEFWILRKTAQLYAPTVAPSVSIGQVERPLLAVYAEPEQRQGLAGFVENLGYRFAEIANLPSAPLGGTAVWLSPGDSVDVLESAVSRFGEVESLFWVEHDSQDTTGWCLRWQRCLEDAGGGARFVALHPYQPISAQRERCELLCRRLGVDLTSLRLVDGIVPQAAAPIRPDPQKESFGKLLETLNLLGIGPHEFFSFPLIQRIEARPEDVRLEKPDGGNFEPYCSSHFLLHPPTPGLGWTRLHVRGLDWKDYRFLATTLSLPSGQAPSVRFQWNIITPQGQRVHTSETVLDAREVKSWVVTLPEKIPAGSFAVLATRVDVAPTHAFAWSTWRDPILFS